jgi:hypothetical protein
MDPERVRSNSSARNMKAFFIRLWFRTCHPVLTRSKINMASDVEVFHFYLYSLCCGGERVEQRPSWEDDAYN